MAIHDLRHSKVMSDIIYIRDQYMRKDMCLL